MTAPAIALLLLAAVFLPVACGLLLDQQRMLMAMVRELQDRPCPHCKAEP